MMSQLTQAKFQTQQQATKSSLIKSNLLQRAAITPVHNPTLQRCSNGVECSECRQKRLEREGILQRAAVDSAPSHGVPPVVHDVLSSSGQPLDAGTRAFMEPRFGHDFSGVRVHTDGRAAESARAVNALAYTVGRDVVFGAGQYAPETSEGRRLLAHELTHTIQQAHTLRTKADGLQVSAAGDEYEHEADHMARVIYHDAQGEGRTEQHIRTVGHSMIQRDDASNPLRMRIPPTPDLRYHPPQGTEPPATSGTPKTPGTPKTLGLFDPLPAVKPVVQSSFPTFKTDVPVAEFAGGSQLILSILGSIKLQSPSKHSIGVGTEGVTIGTPRGSIGVGFGGAVSITLTDRPVKFAATISQDHWEIRLSYPLTTSAPFVDDLRTLLPAANQSIIAVTDELAHFRDFGTATTRISSQIGPLKSTIGALKGIASTPAGPSFGVSLSGGMGGGSGQEGIRFMATFTYSFGKGDKPAKLPPPGSGPRRPAIGHFTSTTSEAIAARIDGPEFESEVPGRGPQSNLSTFLPDLVATVIDKMILAAHDGKDRVDIEMPLGDIPIPSGLSIGLQRMVDAIVATDPKLMGGFQQVGFLIYQTPKDQKDLRSARLGDLVKIIPVRPSLAH